MCSDSEFGGRQSVIGFASQMWRQLLHWRLFWLVSERWVVSPPLVPARCVHNDRHAVTCVREVVTIVASLRQVAKAL